MNSKIFSSNLLKISPDEIVSEINKNGVFYCEAALTKEFLETLESDVESHKFNINENKPSGIYTLGQYYFVNLLSISQVFYDYLTSDLIKNTCSDFLGKNFRLKALRYYETYGRYHMQWHTDNKTDRALADIPGLIFIFYISDVSDGEFQYIQGSQDLSSHSSYNDYSDEFIAKNFADKVLSFKGPRGSLIIYNTYGIHRAKPSYDSRLVRKSVFFQVDKDISNSEPIMLNTAFHKNKDPWVDQFLGIGLQQSYGGFPETCDKYLPTKIKVKSIIKLTLGLAYNLVFSFKPLLKIVRFIKKVLR